MYQYAITIWHRKNFQGCPPPLYSACEIKLLQYHNKIRLIVFVPAQISTDDLSIDNLKFFHCPFTKCMLKVFLNDWQNYVKVKHNLFLLFYLNIFSTRFADDLHINV